MIDNDDDIPDGDDARKRCYSYPETSAIHLRWLWREEVVTKTFRR